jgi:hypothetical protein
MVQELSLWSDLRRDVSMMKREMEAIVQERSTLEATVRALAAAVDKDASALRALRSEAVGRALRLFGTMGEERRQMVGSAAAAGSGGGSGGGGGGGGSSGWEIGSCRYLKESTRGGGGSVGSDGGGARALQLKRSMQAISRVVQSMEAAPVDDDESLLEEARSELRTKRSVSRVLEHERTDLHRKTSGESDTETRPRDTGDNAVLRSGLDRLLRHVRGNTIYKLRSWELADGEEFEPAEHFGEEQVPEDEKAARSDQCRQKMQDKLESFEEAAIAAAEFTFDFQMADLEKQAHQCR